MTRTFVPCLLVVALAWSSVQAAPQPVVRVELTPQQPVLVGQQVRVDVLVLVPNFFTAPPQFPVLDAAGATVTLLDDAVNANETIDGTSYAGIRRTYAVTPQQSGEITLPATRITFQYAAEPGKPGVAGAVDLPAQSLTAKALDGSQGASARAGDGAADTRAAPAPVAQVTIEQSLDRALDGLRAGDALTRTVTAFAPDTPATALPAPSFTAPAGVRVYAHDPVLTDVGARDGAAGGRRSDRVTYVFEKPGRYTLPAIEVAWLDATDHQRKVARAAEIQVSVAPRPGAAAAIAPPAAARGEELADRTRGSAAGWLPWAVAVLAAAVAITLAWRRYASTIRGRLAKRRQARAASESAFFRRLEQTCSTGDAGAAYRALTAWTQHSGWTSLAELCASRPDLGAAIIALEAHLYGRRPPVEAWSGQLLLGAASSVHAATAQRPYRHGRALPALNPCWIATI